MLFRVDPLAPQPIFEQIVFHVKAAVARGELHQGDKLPSVRELAVDASINPNTVVRAYEVLERDGVIVRRQGAGSFVTGGESPLRDERRRQALEAAVERTVTEAFHLGFDAEEVQSAVKEALLKLRFPQKSPEGPRRNDG